MRNDIEWWEGLLVWVLGGGALLILFVGVCTGVGYWYNDLPGAAVGFALSGALGGLFTLVTSQS